ncbi:glycosyltransferase involved in cell wall biosynthesis [Salinibacter ruber]|uniref:glycosyltransferase n=1 Tax=Salinibacter ruber TaxID=146919 RepID=UPI00216A9D56|nr:glycosyltransferase involved in cell wall biosynthesis [Salinibacter ruber]MCS4169873.1 glycosyltransferase involved in cell wall biosynthesis [Salinibacter ruber]
MSQNPRLLKEADTLNEAGYEVRVVAPNKDEEKADLDREIVRERSWLLDSLSVQRETRGGEGHWTWLRAALRQRCCQYLFQAFPRRFVGQNIVDRAYSRYLDELVSKANAQAADLYIAHNLQALPVAARAASKYEVKLGFDAEDFHRGMLTDKASLRHHLTEEIESQYIPRCDYVTAASDGIADAYAEALDIERPTTILNVFPRSEREGHTPTDELEQEKPAGTYSLYWYSQVIGPDRGLQDALRALPQLDERVHISLRGEWMDGFREEFRQLARSLDVAHRVHHLPLVPPEQLIERASQHDVGLALEQADTRNRQICVSNKLLAYLLAGLPVVATDTVGQRGICEDLPQATRLCPIGDPEALAGAVQSLLRDEASLEKAKQAAYRAGEERFCWEKQKPRFIETIRHVLTESQSSLSYA